MDRDAGVEIWPDVERWWSADDWVGELVPNVDDPCEWKDGDDRVQHMMNAPKVQPNMMHARPGANFLPLSSTNLKSAPAP